MPSLENPSAININDTDLPVPVAPATMPWRFAYLASRKISLSPLPIRMSFNVFSR